jgi:hypothetical protein
VPWVGPEQGPSLHWGKDTRCSAPNVVANLQTQPLISFRTRRHVNKACNIYLLMYEV